MTHLAKHLNVVSVAYALPIYVHRLVAPDAKWRFVVVLDGNMPHGHPKFSGVLRRFGDGWQAKQWDTDWGPTVRSRQEAIQVIIPEAWDAILKSKAFDDAKVDLELREAESQSIIQRQKDAGPDLAAAIQRLWRLYGSDVRDPVAAQCREAMEKAGVPLHD